jgi:RNA-binding protein YhbY
MTQLANPETLKNQDQLSLLDHLEKIVTLVGKKGLTRAFFEKANEHIHAVANTLHVSEMQAIIFAHFMNLCDDDSINMGQIAESLRCNKIRLVKFMDDFDELEKKRLIRCRRTVNERRRNTDMPSYRVPAEVISAVRKGIEYKNEKKTNLTIEVFFEELEDLFAQRSSGELSFSSFLNDTRDLENDNTHLNFVKTMKRYQFKCADAVLLLRFCDLFVNNDDDAVGCHDFADIFEDNNTFHSIERELKSGKNYLMELGLVENVNNNGMGDAQYFHLTGKAKEDLLKELKIDEMHGTRGQNFILAGSIKDKKLFYNKREAESVKELAMLLQKDHFTDVQKRLDENGMRKGFACLFHGVPGTGKTETVYQLAKETGRDIMVVDIAETKSCWFGESEKLIKRLFDRYRSVVKSGGLAPILLFNEADAVIGKRRELSGARSGPDQTENAIQNIILEEMEDLEGILIATTNLTKNMDKAFERRFLYKIEFEKPIPETRALIWKSIIPDLSEEDSRILAGKYDFSGGQIENVARKRTVNFILGGTKPSLETLTGYCQHELVNGDGAERVIGFSASYTGSSRSSIVP